MGKNLAELNKFLLLKQLCASLSLHFFSIIRKQMSTSFWFYIITLQNYRQIYKKGKMGNNSEIIDYLPKKREFLDNKTRNVIYVNCKAVPV